MKIEDLFCEDTTKLYRELSKLKLKPSKEMWYEVDTKYFTRRATTSYTEYMSFFRLWKGRLLEQTYAVIKHKGKLHMMEVMRRIEGSSHCIVKDMYYSGMGGYRTAWEWCRPSYYYWNPNCRGEWYIERWNSYNVARDYSKTCKEFIEEHYPELRYNSWDRRCNFTYLDWLIIYKTFPKIEMLAKLKLGYLARSTAFLKNLEDKIFCRWLVKYSAELNGDWFFNNTKMILNAYKNGRTPYEEKQYQMKYKVVLDTLKANAKLKKLCSKERMFKYFEDQNIRSDAIYLDYIRAVEYLGLDLEDTKVLYPKNFMEWHDRYTELYELAQKEKKRKELEEIENSIKSVHDKYIKFEGYKGDYKIVIPDKTQDFIDEGKSLNNCVGRMEYNKKMARDETIILFVRKNKRESLYTMEYDPHEKKIRQFYGHSNTPVPEEIREDIRVWLDRFKIRKKKGVEYLYG